MTNEPQAQLQPGNASDGDYRLQGVLDFVTVPQLLTESENIFKQNNSDIHIDLSGVTQSNSAGLGLLLEWVCRAQAQNKSIRFQNIPAELAAIANAGEVMPLLPLVE